MRYYYVRYYSVYDYIIIIIIIISKLLSWATWALTAATISFFCSQTLLRSKIQDQCIVIDAEHSRVGRNTTLSTEFHVKYSVSRSSNWGNFRDSRGRRDHQDSRGGSIACSGRDDIGRRRRINTIRLQIKRYFSLIKNVHNAESTLWF